MFGELSVATPYEARQVTSKTPHGPLRGVRELALIVIGVLIALWA